MHLLPFDYDAMTPSESIGLANLFPLIEAYQADDVTTLLFDTGDFLQGAPLADLAVRLDETRAHPIADVFNTLGYSALALGNHDFDYGVDALLRVVDDINCPVLSANVTVDGNSAPFPATTILDVPLSTQGTIRLGVVGLTTPVIGLMDESGNHILSTTSPIFAAQQAVDELRQSGADLVLALCHFGLNPDDKIENVAAEIAQIAGIDCVMAGHTHETFPVGSNHTSSFIDKDAGTLHGKPTVMAGSFGQYLGVIELDLAINQSDVTVAGSTVNLVPPNAKTTSIPVQFEGIVPLHERTLAQMSATIAHTTVPFSTEFSLVQPDLTQYLLSDARQLHIERVVAGTSDGDLPILTTAAPFKTGSRSDPGDFISKPAGPITRTDAMAIYPFNNSPVALRRNGAQIKDWLEGAALMFHQITAGETQQALVDPRVPPYRFDTIFGLTYEIDVSAAPGQRICNMRRQGHPVTDTDMFLLVTSTNRLSYGQNIPQADIVHIARESSQDILIQSLRRQSPVTVACPHVWNFKAIPQTKAQFLSSPTADPTPIDRSLHDDGLTAQGLRQFTINFDR